MLIEALSLKMEKKSIKNITLELRARKKASQKKHTFYLENSIRCIKNYIPFISLKCFQMVFKPIF